MVPLKRQREFGVSFITAYLEWKKRKKKKGRERERERKKERLKFKLGELLNFSLYIGNRLSHSTWCVKREISIEIFKVGCKVPLRYLILKCVGRVLSIYYFLNLVSNDTFSLSFSLLLLEYFAFGKYRKSNESEILILSMRLLSCFM